MNIASITRTAGLAALLSLPFACGGGSDGSMPERSSPPARDSRPAQASSASEEDAIPAQAQFDSQATQAINDQNADAEFEKLKQEIEGDG